MLVSISSITDLVTNSSMEVYISATGATIRLMEDVIDGLLELSGSDKRSKDLFIISTDLDSLPYHVASEWVESLRNDDDGDSAKEVISKLEALIDNWEYAEADKLAEQSDLTTLTKYSEDDYSSRCLSVVAKDANCELSIRIAARLSGLMDTLIGEATYDS